MKIVTSATLFAEGSPQFLQIWAARRAMVHLAIEAVRWPPGTDDFAVRPGEHVNGVMPIRQAFAVAMRAQADWSQERVRILQPFRGAFELGPVDFQDESEDATIVEWETGNVASAHRAVNKIALLLKDRLAAYAFLVLPTKSFARNLTDRVSTIEEISPYFDLWRNFNLSRAAFEIIGVEHDREDNQAPLIPKSISGRRIIR